MRTLESLVNRHKPVDASEFLLLKPDDARYLRSLTSSGILKVRHFPKMGGEDIELVPKSPYTINDIVLGTYRKGRLSPYYPSPDFSASNGSGRRNSKRDAGEGKTKYFFKATAYAAAATALAVGILFSMSKSGSAYNQADSTIGYAGAAQAETSQTGITNNEAAHTLEAEVKRYKSTKNSSKKKVSAPQPEQASADDAYSTDGNYSSLETSVSGAAGASANYQPTEKTKSSDKKKKKNTAPSLGEIAATPSPESESAYSAQAGEAYDCAISDSFPDSIRQWGKFICNSSRKHNLDPNIIASVMLVESGGQPDVVSYCDAVGLMQVMPNDGDSACVYNWSMFSDRPSSSELFDPRFNIDYGADLLESYINRTGSIREGLFSYGPSGVGYDYADKVLGIFDSYK